MIKDLKLCFLINIYKENTDFGLVIILRIAMNSNIRMMFYKKYADIHE